MCLYIAKDATSKIAEEDITVYKVLHGSSRDDDGTVISYLSPFRHFIYHIGQEYTSGISFSEVVEPTKIAGHPFYEGLSNISYETLGGYAVRTVERGLHSFVNYKEAVRYATTCYGARILECVIPKGTVYYSGEWLFDGVMCTETIKVDSYASEKLYTVKEVV